MKNNKDLLILAKLAKKAICKKIAKEFMLNLYKISKLKKNYCNIIENDNSLHLNNLYYTACKKKSKIRKKEIYYKVPNIYMKKNA